MLHSFVGWQADDSRRFTQQQTCCAHVPDTLLCLACILNRNTHTHSHPKSIAHARIVDFVHEPPVVVVAHIYILASCNSSSRALPIPKAATTTTTTTFWIGSKQTHLFYSISQHTRRGANMQHMHAHKPNTRSYTYTIIAPPCGALTLMRVCVRV